MRVGITLPVFTRDPATTLAVATEAERSSLDGVFVFDHLWPIGGPGRPALAGYPMLGAVAAVTDRVRVGPLVARIGLLPDEIVGDSLRSLQQLAGGRLLATLGIGDRLSIPEHDALGIAVRTVYDRRASLGLLLDELVEVGIECWVGATSPATQAVARARAVPVNLWDVDDAVVAAEAALGEVTWAGPMPGDVEAAAARLRRLDAAGATWAIWGWPVALGDVAEASRLAGVGAMTE